MALFSAAVQEALALHGEASSKAVHGLELALAALLVQHGPTGAHAQLELAQRYLAGGASAAELRSAEQDCWTYVGSLACGCSVADSATGAAILACLNGDESAHTAQSLREQVERALSAGASEAQVRVVLASREWRSILPDR